MKFFCKPSKSETQGPNQDILGALDSATASVDSFVEELSGMLSHVGVNDDMQKIRDLGARAFDWGAILQRDSPNLRANGEAFLQFAKELKPFLKNTRWPDAEIFAGVRPECLLGFNQSLAY